MVIGAVDAAFAKPPTMCIRPAQAVAQAISLRGSGSGARGIQRP